MQTLLTIVAFLFIFSLLILVHEWGHFYMAKRKGIKVEEFGFGLPPRIWGKKYGETLYSLNWIPFGGFVRMLGEDSSDKKAKSSKRSFSNKTKWERTQVITAGVFMNFLLAWLLFTIGFSVGMQPLVVSGDDFLSGVRNGQITMEPGVMVDKVKEGSWAEDNGFEEGTPVLTVNGMEMGTASEDLMQINPEMVTSMNGIPFEGEEMGLEFNVFELPRVVMESGGGLEMGDFVLGFEGEVVFYAIELRELMESQETFSLTVLRDGAIETVAVTPMATDENVGPRTIISKVFPDSPAEEAGLQERDRVKSVNGVEVTSPEHVVEIVTESDTETLSYEVMRAGELQAFEISRNEEGLVGVLLGDLDTHGDLVFYDGGLLSSVVNVEDIKYPVHKAAWQSLVEMKRIGIFTAVMIAQLFGDVFMSASVPDEVAGPVGIAQLTGVYVQEGLVALIRFTGLLSLSLAVINIFPFPALDGGRQLFIIIEAVRGKPLDARFEGYIHTVGFLFLIGVILLVTFQDIARFFQ